MKTPDFHIIGGARCGTTALIRILEQHPDIYISKRKEPHFFALAGQDVNYQGPGDQEAINEVAVTNWADYQDLYAARNGQSAAGEGSVSSLYFYQQAVANLKQYAPDTKLIAILRNPVERAYSSYMYQITNGYEPETDFMTALDQEKQRIDAGWHHIWHYIQMGMFAEQVRAFQEAFGSDQFKVVLFDDFKKDGQGVVADLCRFIGVPDDVPLDTSKQVNLSGVPKNEALQKVLRKPSLIKSLVKLVTPASLRAKIRNANLSKPRMSAEARAWLCEVFREDVGRLGDLLGRDLSHWVAAR